MKRNVQILLLIIGLSSISCDETSVADAPVIDISNIAGPPRSPRAILGGGGGKETVGGGRPGEDFPVLNSVPRTDFSCSGLLPGYYADESTGCQVFHICHSDLRKDSFLCPNGTMFHQLRLICDWWYNVDCKGSQVHQKVNADIGKSDRSRSIGVIDLITSLPVQIKTISHVKRSIPTTSRPLETTTRRSSRRPRTSGPFTSKIKNTTPRNPLQNSVGSSLTRAPIS